MYDVYEYDILSKREDLLRNVVNRKVNRMIRYGLEPKENKWDGLKASWMNRGEE